MSASIIAPQIIEKAVSASVLAAVDFTPFLRSGEILTGSPTATEMGGTTDLMLGTPARNTAPMLVDGALVPASQGVTFTITGGTANRSYQIAVQATTTSSQTPIIICRLRIIANT